MNGTQRSRLDMRIGIVGVGNVAMNNYLPWLARQEGAELYYYSRTAAKSEAAVRQFGGYRMDSLDELARQNLDVIFILTNETSHSTIAQELLKYRVKRLFIEKPLHAANGQADVTEQDFFLARKMLRQAKEIGTEVAMIFNYRFYDQSLNLKKLIQERDLGQLLQSTWFVHYACWSHCIDLLSCFGGPIKSITALSGDRVFGAGSMAGMTGKDVAAAFTHHYGAVGTIVGTSASSFQLPLYHVTMNFERGTVTFSDLDSQLTLYREGSHFSETFSLIPDKSRWVQYNASFEKSLAAYFQAIRNGEKPPVTGLDGLLELQFEAALKRSAAAGRPVELDAEFPIDL